MKQNVLKTYKSILEDLNSIKKINTGLRDKVITLVKNISGFDKRGYAIVTFNDETGLPVIDDINNDERIEIVAVCVDRKGRLSFCSMAGDEDYGTDRDSWFEEALGIYKIDYRQLTECLMDAYKRTLL